MLAEAKDWDGVARLHLPNDNEVRRKFSRGHGHETFCVEMVSNLVRPGDNVLDLGANIGVYSILLSKLVGPSGSVTCFEPDPETFGLLCKNLVGNGCMNVTPHRAAVLDRHGTATLHRTGDNAESHSLRHDAGSTPVEVGSVVLDDLLPPGRSYPFIKIDVEGSEFLALKGARKVILRSFPCAMLLELWPVGLKSLGGSVDDLDRLLYELGFGKRYVVFGERMQRVLKPLNTLVRADDPNPRAIAQLLVVK